MRRSLAILAFLAPTTAMAHAELTDPDPRSACVNATNCKTAPCGTIPTGAVTKVFFVGSSYDINWNETIEHPGNYRLALSTNGDLGFDSFIIQDLIPDMPTAPNSYTMPWTVPNITTCQTKCVMQLLQIMTDNPGTTYYNCADIQILAAGSATPTPTPGPTATPTPGGNPDGAVSVDGYGSCAVGGFGSRAFAHGAVLMGLALGVSAFVRRRR